MTPAINMVKKLRVAHCIHEYKHDPSSQAYGLEAAEKLEVDQSQVYKTLVVKIEGKGLAVAVIPVAKQLSLKLLAKILKEKKVTMALPKDVERSTGYVLGGVSPLGQKKLLPTIIDSSASEHSTIYVSAGKRGLEIELSIDDLAKMTRATLAEIKS